MIMSKRRISVKAEARTCCATMHHPGLCVHRSATRGASPARARLLGAQELPLGGIVRRAWSEALKEIQQFVIGLITARFPLNGLGLSQDLLFQGKVGVQIDLGGFN